MFDHLIAALVHGSGYERIASPGCSDRTLRRWLREWAQAGHGPALLRICLAAYDRMIGLDLHDLAVDGCITKAPCGGKVAGRSPVDRGKQGMKRAVAADGAGIPLHLVAARANDHDSPLLEPTLAGVVDMIGTLPQYRDLHGGDEFPNVHLDRGYDSAKTRELLDVLGFTPHIAVKGQPAPIQAGRPGRSNARTRGSTATASCAAAPTSARSPGSTCVSSHYHTANREQSSRGQRWLRRGLPASGRARRTVIRSADGIGRQHGRDQPGMPHISAIGRDDGGLIGVRPDWAGIDSGPLMAIARHGGRALVE